MTKPLILVTNDDGIDAPGIRKLAEIASEVGEVFVVAPDKPQSGKSHSITVADILSLKELDFKGSQHDFACSGTPVDCVKIALDKVLDRTPDLVLSGINHGSNSAINVLYSGTMGAAMEAGIEGIPAIGFSLHDFNRNADFDAAAPFVKDVILKGLDLSLPQGVVLNVNIPKLKREEIQGIKICRQAKSRWVESYEERENPHGKKYYWLNGNFENIDLGLDADENAIDAGYITIVPVQCDMTAYEYLPVLKRSLL